MAAAIVIKSTVSEETQSKLAVATDIQFPIN